METLFGFGLLFTIVLIGAFAVFAVGGWIVAWLAFFEVRRLRAEWKARSGDSAPPPVPSYTPSPSEYAAPRPASVFQTEVAPPPQAAPTPPPPPRVRGVWEQRFLDNWTGLAGLVIVVLGLGFLTTYAAAVMPPFGRFALIVAGALAAAGAGIFLERRVEKWKRWGYWLQSFGAAVFLLACLGAGGIPGVAWVEQPLPALVLLLTGVVVNFVLGYARRRQPYLTLHLVLSLTALSVPAPNAILVVCLTITALLGLSVSWFQKWAYHRAVTVGVFHGVLALAVLRGADTPWLFVVAASVAVALLAHLASYRRLEHGADWSRAAFVTHLLNAAGAGLVCALWAPREPWVVSAVLAGLALVLAFLSLRARRTGTNWLHRTDRSLALAVAGIALAFNPVGARPGLVVAAFAALAVVFAWTARREGDAWLARIAEWVQFAALAVLTVFSVFGTTPEAWYWTAGASTLVGALAAWSLGRAPESSARLAAFLVLPAVFAVPPLALTASLVTPAWIALPGWVVLTLLLHRTSSAPLTLATTAGTAALFVAGLFGLVSWHLTGWEPLLHAAPLTLLALLPLATAHRVPGLRPVLSWVAAGFVCYALLFTGAVWPEVPLVLLLALGWGLWAARAWLEKWDQKASSPLLWVVAGFLAIARLTAETWDPQWSFAVVDAAVAASFVVWAWSRRPGAPFWEFALAWLLGTAVFDLPHVAYPLWLAALAVGTLLASRSRKGILLEWYAFAVFALACVVSLFAYELWVRLASLGVLAAFVFLDAGASSHRGRRYAVVFVYAAAAAFALPAALDSAVWTLGWSLEAALLFGAAILWRDSLFRYASFVALAACLARLLLVDLAASDLLVKAASFLSVGLLLVGMNVVYQWSKNRPTRPSGDSHE